MRVAKVRQTSVCLLRRNERRICNTGGNATVTDRANVSTFNTLPEGRVSACVSHLPKNRFSLSFIPLRKTN